MPDLHAEIQRARERFLAWLKWYRRTHPGEVPSWAELARKIGVTPSAVNQWMSPGSTRCPSFDAIVGAKRLTGFAVDVLMFGEPPGHEMQPAEPVSPRRRTRRKG